MAVRIEKRNNAVSGWVYGLTTGALSKVTPNALSGSVWSPDGTQLAIEGGEGRTLDIYRTAAEQSDDPELVIRNDKPKYAASWTRDGRTLVYMQFEDPKTREDLWAIDLDGNPTHGRLCARRRASLAAGCRRTTSGWRTRSNETGQFEVFLTPFPSGGRRWQISTDGAREPVWSRDGHELFFRSRDGRKMMAVIVHPGSTFKWDAPRLLFEGAYFILVDPAPPRTTSRWTASAF